MLACVHYSVIQDMEANQVPINRQVDKKWWYTQTYILEYYETIQKNEILPFVAEWTDLGGWANTKRRK